MATKKLLNRYGGEETINLADGIEINASADGFELLRADGTIDKIQYDIIDGTTKNPKLTISLIKDGGTPTVLKTVPLNQNDVSLDGSASDFDLTDDTINFVDSDGQTQGTLNFSKYNVSITTNAGWDIEISQNGNLLTTVSQNADGIAYDNSTSGLTATDVQWAIDEVNTKADNFSGWTEEQDDFVATVWQTAFTLSQTPISQVNINRNGVLLAKACLSVSGTTATYDPTQNGANAMVAGDRVTFTYEY